MAVPQHSWVHSGGDIHLSIRERISKLPNLKVLFRDFDFINKLGSDPRTHDMTIDDMDAAIHHVIDQRINPPVGPVENGAAVSLVERRKATIALEKGEIDFNKISVDEILEAHKVTGKPLKPTGAKTVEPLQRNIAPQREQKFFSNLSSEQKIYGGMSLLMAGLSAAGAINSFRQAVGKDETGATQIQWSHVGMGLVSATLAAGTAYLAHQQLRGPSHAL